MSSNNRSCQTQQHSRGVTKGRPSRCIWWVRSWPFSSNQPALCCFEHCRLKREFNQLVIIFNIYCVLFIYFALFPIDIKRFENLTIACWNFKPFSKKASRAGQTWILCTTNVEGPIAYTCGIHGKWIILLLRSVT